MLKKTLIGVLVVALLSNFLITGTNFNITKAVNYSGSGTYVGGYIGSNTTWSLENSPYIVTEDVIVEPDVFLIIEAGVVIKFAINTSLIIDGALITQGNSTHRIVFTSNATTPQPGDWGGIRFKEDSSESSIINWAIVEYASRGVWVDRSSHRIENSIIRNNDYGVSVMFSAGAITISNSSIFNNTWGIYTWEIGTGNRADVYDSIVFNNKYGISMDILQVTRCNVSKNDIFGIKGRLLSISRSVISKNNGTGIACYYGTTTITFSTITDNGENGVFANQYVYGPITEIHYSKIYNNSPYDIYNEIGTDVDATYNWWGTTNETVIKEHIYDYYDDYNLGRVLYKPFLVPPVANFVFSPEMPYACGAVTFDASASFNSYGSIINYTWDFGDGNTTTTTSPVITHVYVIPSSYNVTLMVTDEFGLKNSTVTSLTILEDDVPPMIGIPFHTPEGDIQPDQNVKVSVNVTDFESGVKNVTLSYNLNDSTVWIDLPLALNSTTRLYETTIKIQQAHTLVKYKITAYDNAGNYRVEDNSGQYYVYMVIPEFPSTIILPLFMLTTLIATVLLKKKRKAKPQLP